MSNAKAYVLSIMRDERKSIDGYIVGFFLSIASFIYLFLLKCIYFLYKQKILRPHEVDAKVISIGNITLGGTGKTPFTIAFAENIKAMGRKAAVLNRGYGNDESYLLKERLGDIPVLIGKNRVKNADIAKNRLGSDFIILDDGFQHHRIKRDFDIVLIDATSPFGNFKLFPRGILREPLSRLKDADLVILTKSDMGRNNTGYIRNIIEQFNKKAEIAESFYQPVCLKKIFSEEITPLNYIINKKVALLTAIANPAYFDWIVGNLGAEVVEKFYYPDHYPYRDKDITSAAKKCLDKGISLIVTTEKDAVRLRRLSNMPQEVEIFALRIISRISSNEKYINDRLHSIYNS